MALLGPLKAGAPERKITVFSLYDDPAFAAPTLEAGAVGYITKSDNPDVLVQTIESVSGGNVFLTVSMVERLVFMNTGVSNDPLRNLSTPEREVLGFLGEGKTLIEIADLLNVSYRTSASTTAQIKTKLNITSTPALIKWAADHQRVRSGIA